MENNIAIKVEHLSKVYKIFDKPFDRVKESLNPFGKRYSKDFYALNDVSFEIKKGETIGIIGKNGAGKSTLLKMITGVLTPTSGSLQVNGRIASLLELGAGFNPEMTGIENIYMNGSIMGYSKEEMDDRLENIIAFADIGDFIHQPVKMYSSGMFARLAFAVNAYVEPDILIVDEALSVGDAFFQAKCLMQMKKLMEIGTTILFVSHDTNIIKSFCQRILYLDNGGLKMDGMSDDVIETYLKSRQETIQKNKMEEKDVSVKNIECEKTDIIGDACEFNKIAVFNRVQNGKLLFYNVFILNKEGQRIKSISYNQEVKLRFVIKANEEINEDRGYGIHVKNSCGISVFYFSSRIDKVEFPKLEKGMFYFIDIELKLPLQAGEYFILCALGKLIQPGVAEYYDYIPCAAQFCVNALPNGQALYGCVCPEHKVEIKKVSGGENLR